MNHKRPPFPAIVILALVIGLSAYFLYTQNMARQNHTLTASGFIEGTQINLAPELAGKVIEVLVEEGQTVRTGETLLRLDPSLLTAQRAVAAAQVESARGALLTAQQALALSQAQSEAALLAARAQEGKARLSDWIGQPPSLFDQPLWYFSREEQIAAAQAGVQAAAQALLQAEADLQATIRDLNNAAFLAAETRLAQARFDYLVAKMVYDHAQATGGSLSPQDISLPALPPGVDTYRLKISVAKALSSESEVLDAAREMLDQAEAELQAAQQAYNDLLNSQAGQTILQARAAVSVATERYEVARDLLNRLQSGEHAPQVTIASLGVEQARAALAQAESAVRQAEANLALIDTQITRLTLVAPTDGVILTRNVEVGEFVQPGTVAFVLGQLTDLTITVYIPEDRYGEISLGQSATVTVDSFPGQTFSATVIRIADRAEFTPRNVQTVEGRRSTVYAITLAIPNPEGKLKIGMPADVTFETQPLTSP